MKTSSKIALLGIGLGVLGLTLSTGAFSQITADRGSHVESASDQSALIGLDVENPVDAGQNSTLVTVSNHINRDIEVFLELTENTDDGVTLDKDQATIPQGSSEVFDVDINTSKRPPPQRIEFELTATGPSDDFSVVLTRNTRIR